MSLTSGAIIGRVAQRSARLIRRASPIDSVYSATPHHTHTTTTKWAPSNRPKRQRPPPLAAASPRRDRARSVLPARPTSWKSSEPTTSSPSPRVGAGGALGDSLIVVGGHGAGGEALADVWIHHITSGAWKPPEPTPAERRVREAGTRRSR